MSSLSSARPVSEGRPIRSVWQTSGYGLVIVGLALGDVFVTAPGITEQAAEALAWRRFNRASGEGER